MSADGSPELLPPTQEHPVDSPEPDSPEPKKSRAGRNLPAAIAVGVVLLGAIIASLVFLPPTFIGIVSAGLAVATWELTRRLREADVLVPRIPLLVGGQAMIWTGWPWGPQGVLGSFAVTAVVLMVWRLLDAGHNQQPRNYLRDTSVAVFAAAWLPLFAAFAVLMVLAENGPARVACFIAVVVCSDVGGYAAGVFLGKHPMAPAISPKKSWEGFAGSVTACMLGGATLVSLMLDQPWFVGVGLGLVLVVTASIGDLIESQVKRELGIKDMGTLLPGHGGIMDRLDSLLPSAVASWAFFALVLG